MNVWIKDYSSDGKPFALILVCALICQNVYINAIIIIKVVLVDAYELLLSHCKGRYLSLFSYSMQHMVEWMKACSWQVPIMFRLLVLVQKMRKINPYQRLPFSVL